MPSSCSNTGNTDLRETEVQQPNTAETLSTDSNCRAFSANRGQFEAGSTTTASSGRPITPPFLFCSAISISITSFSGASLIAMVPESECRMPTLIGPVSGAAGAAFADETSPGNAPSPEAAAASPALSRPRSRRPNVKPSDDMQNSPPSCSHARRGGQCLPRGQARTAALGGGGKQAPCQTKEPAMRPGLWQHGDAGASNHGNCP